MAYVKNRNTPEKIKICIIGKLIVSNLFDRDNKIIINAKLEAKVPHAAPATPNNGTKIIVKKIFNETPIKEA